MDIRRSKAIDLLHQYIKNQNMLNHCYASEVVMMALAKRLGRDEREKICRFCQKGEYYGM